MLRSSVTARINIYITNYIVLISQKISGQRYKPNISPSEKMEQKSESRTRGLAEVLLGFPFVPSKADRDELCLLLF